MSNEKPTFKVDQKIVYPSQGVGKIVEIKERKFKNEMVLYYVIYLEVSDMTVLVPVSRSEELGIRAIVSPEEAQKALDMIGEEFEPVTTDWKLRYQMNQLGREYSPPDRLHYSVILCARRIPIVSPKVCGVPQPRKETLQRPA